MRWFGAGERGLALGVRQTAMPVGGTVAALVLPALGGPRAAAASSSSRRLLPPVRSSGPSCCGRGGDEHELETGELRADAARRPSLRLASASGVYLFAQVALIGFLVALPARRPASPTARRPRCSRPPRSSRSALRIGVGRWSDVVGSRIVPLRLIGVAVAVALGAAALAGGPLGCSCPSRRRNVLSMAWNGLSFTIAAELAAAAAAPRSASSRRCSRDRDRRADRFARRVAVVVGGGVRPRCALPARGVAVLRPLRGH